jgi:hypothetical protein
MAASEPTLAVRRGLESYGMWQRWNPPRQRGNVQSYRARGSAGAHLDREAGSRAVGHVAARGCTPYFWFCLEACKRGYPVCRVPTVAPDPTSRTARNLYGDALPYSLELSAVSPTSSDKWAWAPLSLAVRAARGVMAPGTTHDVLLLIIVDRC